MASMTVQRNNKFTLYLSQFESLKARIAESNKQVSEIVKTTQQKRKETDARINEIGDRISKKPDGETD